VELVLADEFMLNIFKTIPYFLFIVGISMCGNFAYSTNYLAVQDTISKKDTLKKEVSFVKLENLQMLYANVENLVEISVKGFVNNKLLVYTDNGLIIKVSEKNYLVLPRDTGSITLIVKLGMKKLKEKKLPVRLPEK
jgi:hypothetical protein